MSVPRTARERARAEVTAAIKDEARRQLADSGASGLSLRAVARELGMVSSALYRYFPSRDDLLTALITDAYAALAARTAKAAADHETSRERWLAGCRAVRTWALEHRHEYLLIYGTPVPGYEAPEATTAVAQQVIAPLLTAVRDAWDEGALRPAEAEPNLSPTLREHVGRIATQFDLAVPEEVLVRAAIAWTQLFGMLTFELTGQLANTFDPPDAFFEHATGQLARYVGFDVN